MKAGPFESARLLIRAPTADDAPALYEAYRDPGVMRFWSSPPHGSVAETVDYVTPHAGDQWRQWVIVEKASNAAIGTLAAGERRRVAPSERTTRRDDAPSEPCENGSSKLCNDRDWEVVLVD